MVTVNCIFIKEHDEDISHQELTKRLAIEWNNLAQEKKKVTYLDNKNF